MKPGALSARGGYLVPPADGPSDSALVLVMLEAPWVPNTQCIPRNMSDWSIASLSKLLAVCESCVTSDLVGRLRAGSGSSLTKTFGLVK